jgi:hypothetical protein
MWFAIDMDDGILHQAPTRREVVEWCRHNIGIGGRVLERHCYGPGSYDYYIGTDRNDCDSVAVMREDALPYYGLSEEHRKAWFDR